VTAPAAPSIDRAALRSRLDLPLLASLLAAAVVGLVLPGMLAGRSGRIVQLLPFALVLAIGLVLLAFSRPATLFVIGFFLLAVVRTNPAPVDVVFVLLMLATLSRRRPFSRVPPLVGLGLALFGILSIASMLNVVELGRAFVFELTTLYLIVLGLWLSGIFADETLTRRALKAYVVAALASAILALSALELKFPGSSFFLYDSQRPKALFKDPNVLGPFLVPAAAIMLEEIMRPRLFRWSWRRSLVVFAILCMGVVFSFSRAGWLNLGIAIAAVVGVYAARRRGFEPALRSLAAIAVCLVVGIGLLAATGSLGFLQSRSHLATYDQQRFGTQAAAFGKASKHVLGFGPGQSEIELNLSTHSLYARVVYEQGYVGATLVAAILGLTILAASGLAARDVDLHGLGSAALLGSWLGLLANSFFIDTLHWRHLWIVAALIWSASVLSHRDETATRPAAREVRNANEPQPLELRAG
jgi:hypothetical protein